MQIFPFATHANAMLAKLRYVNCPTGAHVGCEYQRAQFTRATKVCPRDGEETDDGTVQRMSTLLSLRGIPI